MKVSTHKGQVSFPGGVRDEGNCIDSALSFSLPIFLPGESLATCCLRECQEEIGITLNHSDLLGQLPSGRSISGMKVTPFVAFLGDIDPARLHLSTDEISEAFCVGVDDLLDGSKVEVQNFDGGWSIPRYLGGAHPVWGLTAYITQYFLAQASSASKLAPHTLAQLTSSCCRCCCPLRKRPTLNYSHCLAWYRQWSALAVSGILIPSTLRCSLL
jgi:8-oxo-dGTP pyrophosphatase MutT (NUDIX family)